MPSPSPLRPLGGRDVLVTGLLGGVGAQLAKQLLLLGAGVAVHHPEEEDVVTEDSIDASGGQGLTHVPIPLNLSFLCPIPLNFPTQTQINPWMWPEGAQVELSRERCVPKVLKLSFEVSECKPLAGGCCGRRTWATAWRRRSAGACARGSARRARRTAAGWVARGGSRFCLRRPWRG